MPPPASPRMARMSSSGGGGRGIRVRSPSVVRRSPKPSISCYSPAARDDTVLDDDGFGTNTNNRVMIVVDSGSEARGALELALSHTVLQTHNSTTIILLYVASNSNDGGGAAGSSAYDLLCSLKKLCQRKRGGVRVEVAIRQGKNRGAVIVEEAKKQRVSMLVMGQRKRWGVWRLIRRLKKGRRGGGDGGEGEAVVKYCIEKAGCLTIGVRRQGRKLGGYLITTKRHKNFWLLA